MWSVRLFHRFSRKTVVSMICNMKPCNIMQYHAISHLGRWRHAISHLFVDYFTALWDMKKAISHLGRWLFHSSMRHEAMQYHTLVVDYFTALWDMKPCNITPWSWLFHSSMRVIKLQPVFKVCNISYLYVLFHSSELLLTFWYINHKMIKGKEWIHVTTNIIQYHILR
jgi:hypothetical protein